MWEPEASLGASHSSRGKNWLSGYETKTNTGKLQNAWPVLLSVEAVILQTPGSDWDSGRIEPISELTCIKSEKIKKALNSRGSMQCLDKAHLQVNL